MLFKPQDLQSKPGPEKQERQFTIIFYLKNPFQFCLPIFITNFVIILWETIEYVGDVFPSKYIERVYEDFENYHNVPFGTTDLNMFPHLYFLREKKLKNRDRKIMEDN